MRRLFLDIETLPAHEDHHEKLKYLHEKHCIKAKKEKEFDEFLRETSFDGAFGRILCIAYAIDDNPVEVLNGDNDEAGMLKKFWEIVGSISMPARDPRWPDYGLQFIGHNVMDFDLRFMYQRSIVSGVKPTYNLSFARYKDYPIYDTMREWTKWNMTNSVSLERIALALGIPTPKDGIDGSQVADFHQAGKTKEILEYCQRDVEATRLVYKRMTFEN